jgi:hypothetical protein
MNTQSSFGAGAAAVEPNEEAMVKTMFAEINRLKDTNPDFFAFLDDVDPDTASRSDLVDLMASAPNEKIAFYLFGKYSMRLMMAAITGREFR